MKLKSYKHTVWKSCAWYVKVRESNTHGKVKCVTCPKILSIYDQECNAGHFVPGRGNAVLFDDAHIFPQCSGCNCDGGGEQHKFGEFLKRKYGYDNNKIDEILDMRHKTRKFTLEELKGIKRNYDTRAMEICKEKGISFDTRNNL